MRNPKTRQSIRNQPDMSHATTPPPKLRATNNATLRLVRRKWERLNIHNEHWMCCIVGEEGMGKSYTALKIGSLIDPNFDDENVFFRPADMLERLRDEEYESGEVWVLDEAGVGLGNRTWHDTGQKKLNQALQLVRSHNIGFIFTLPRLGELDKQAKGRLQNALEIVNKNDGKYVQGPWWRSNVDRMDMQGHRNSTWWTKPQINGKEIGAVAFSPPSETVIEPYEEVKSEFQQNHYDETIKELRGQSENGDEPQSASEIVDDIVDTGDVDEYLREINNGAQLVLDTDLIAMKYEIGNPTAKRVKKGLLSKMDDNKAEEIV